MNFSVILPLARQSGVLFRIVAWVLIAAAAGFFQLAFNHHLRGNAGMIGADHPERVVAAEVDVGVRGGMPLH